MKFKRMNENQDVETLVANLVDAYKKGNDNKIGKAWGELMDETVPAADNADTVGGEIVRAVNRIMYRNWNDGDCIGVDYGNETCNAPARYLMDTVKDSKIVNQIKDMWGYQYRFKEATKLGKMVAEYLQDNLDLFTEKNRDDMWDWQTREDFEYDSWDDDDDYDDWDDHDSDDDDDD